MYLQLRLPCVSICVQYCSDGLCVLVPGGACTGAPVYRKYGFLRSRVLLDDIKVPSMCRSMVTSYDCLRLASRSTRPVRVWPCLMKIGMGSRHRTWYQCVSGAVGDVDSQTCWLLPLNSTSNQKARPWQMPVCNMWNSSGISKQRDSC